MEETCSLVSLLRMQMKERKDILGISTKRFLFRPCSFNNVIIYRTGSKRCAEVTPSEVPEMTAERPE